MSNTTNIFVEKTANIDIETISTTNGSIVYVPNATSNSVNVYSSVTGGSMLYKEWEKHWEEKKFYNKVKKLLEE